MSHPQVTKEEALLKLARLGRVFALLSKRHNPRVAALQQMPSQTRELQKLLGLLGQRGRLDDPELFRRITLLLAEQSRFCRAQGWLVEIEHKEIPA